MAQAVDEEDWKKLRQLEEDLWIEETRFDVSYMNQLLAEDFMEYGRSGRVYLREDTLAVPRQQIEVTLPLPDLQIRLLAPDVAQVTYNSEMVFAGEVQYGHRSSIWVRSGESWILKFHQGTPYVPDT